MKTIYILCLFVGILFGAFIQQANASTLEDKILYDAMIDVRVFNQYSIQTLEPEEMMEFAYNTGKDVNLGETLRAIVFLESNFGVDGRIGDNGVARGVTQIQIPTAHFILEKLIKVKYHFTNEEITKLITYNDKVSIIMSKYYLVYLMKKFKDHTANWSKALLSYNVGLSGVKNKGLKYDPNNYIEKAKWFINKQRG